MHHDSEDHSQTYTSKMSSMMRTWHPHVYALPPKQPTPHFIIDILGIEEPNQVLPHNQQQAHNGHMYHRPQHFHSSCSNSSSCGSFSPPMVSSAAEEGPKTVIDQPLNLSCSDKVRGETPSPGKLTPFRVVQPLETLKPPLGQAILPPLGTSTVVSSAIPVGNGTNPNTIGTNPNAIGTNSVSTVKGKSSFSDPFQCRLTTRDFKSHCKA